MRERAAMICGVVLSTCNVFYFCWTHAKLRCSAHVGLPSPRKGSARGRANSPHQASPQSDTQPGCASNSELSARDIRDIRVHSMLQCTLLICPSHRPSRTQWWLRQLESWPFSSGSLMHPVDDPFNDLFVARLLDEHVPVLLHHHQLLVSRLHSPAGVGNTHWRR